MLDTVLPGFQLRAQEKSIGFECTIDDHVPPRLSGDSHRFAQIIVNLLSNAMKFTTDGTVGLTIQPDRTVGDFYQLQVSVSDTGVGIPEDKLDSIFEAFSQADGSTTREFGGTGLGLTITSHLVHRMGGRIWVDSTVGTGSTFHCIVKFAPPSEAEEETQTPVEEAKPDTTVRKLNILLAEDNLVNQKVAAGLLRKAGHTVDIADNGRIALEAAEKGSYDVVMMDVQMPEMDGLEATRHIRERIGTDLPIVAMTAHAMAGDRQRCLDAGMDEYVSKPVTIEAMLEAIAKCVREEAASTADASHDPEPEPTEDTEDLDIDALAARTGGREILAEIAQMFLEGYDEQMETLQNALTEGDGEGVQKAAHKIKGSLLVFDLTAASELAYLAESSGQSNDLDTAHQAVTDLTKEITRILPKLRALAALS